VKYFSKEFGTFQLIFTYINKSSKKGDL